MKASYHKRIARLESGTGEAYHQIAEQEYRAGRITAQEREIYLGYMKQTGGVIPPIAWIDWDSEFTSVLRKMGCYPDSVFL